MDRYILRFSGPGEKPLSDVERIRSCKELNVVDESPRMLLVEGQGQDIARLAASLAGWTLAKEQFVPLPDPRQKIRRPAR